MTITPIPAAAVEAAYQAMCHSTTGLMMGDNMRAMVADGLVAALPHLGRTADGTDATFHDFYRPNTGTAINPGIPEPARSQIAEALRPVGDVVSAQDPMLLLDSLLTFGRSQDGAVERDLRAAIAALAAENGRLRKDELDAINAMAVARREARDAQGDQLLWQCHMHEEGRGLLALAWKQRRAAEAERGEARRERDEARGMMRILREAFIKTEAERGEAQRELAAVKQREEALATSLNKVATERDALAARLRELEQRHGSNKRFDAGRPVPKHGSGP